MTRTWEGSRVANHSSVSTFSLLKDDLRVLKGSTSEVQHAVSSNSQVKVEKQNGLEKMPLYYKKNSHPGRSCSAKVEIPCPPNLRYPDPPVLHISFQIRAGF